ncbi:fluoride efflux transporter CrcB [Effusibacillus consociatus]|uniref:Fluoride-specific ion channel FluC n=1 Tax=Effusibacillus consociatus TaxID=1117041 RepID=A0ABV9Q6K3_9BACL
MWSLVAIGGAFGAIVRWQAGIWLMKQLPIRWPIGTFFVNASGSFLMGVLANLQTAPSVWSLLGTGFLGAFTTFSTFGYETVQMLQAKEWERGLSYVLASVATGFVACWLGLYI